MSTTRTALVIIDMQAVLERWEDDPRVAGTLLTIRGLLDRARATGTPVVFVQHDGGPGHPLEVGTPGWAIHPAIAPRLGEPVVRKRAADAFYKTELRETLSALGITHLVVTGTQTEECVDTTCRRALSEGYDVTLVADGHTTGDREDMTAARIIAHHNDVLGDLTHPDHHITVARAEAVAL